MCRYNLLVIFLQVVDLQWGLSMYAWHGNKYLKAGIVQHLRFPDLRMFGQDARRPSAPECPDHSDEEAISLGLGIPPVLVDSLSHLGDFNPPSIRRIWSFDIVEAIPLNAKLNSFVYRLGLWLLSSKSPIADGLAAVELQEPLAALRDLLRRRIDIADSDGDLSTLQAETEQIDRRLTAAGPAMFADLDGQFKVIGSTDREILAKAAAQSCALGICRDDRYPRLGLLTYPWSPEHFQFRWQGASNGGAASRCQDELLIFRKFVELLGSSPVAPEGEVALDFCEACANQALQFYAFIPPKEPVRS